MCGHLASPVLLLQNNQMFRQTQGGVQAPAFTDLSVIKKGDKKKTPDNEVPEDLVENKGEEPKSSKDETEVDQQEEIACNEIEERRDEGIEEKETVETKSGQDEPVTEKTPIDVAQQRIDDKIEKGDVENFQKDKPADDRQEEKKSLAERSLRQQGQSGNDEYFCTDSILFFLFKYKFHSTQSI